MIEEQDTALLVPGGRGSELDWFPWLRFIMREVHKDIMNMVDLHWFVFDSLLQKKKVRNLRTLLQGALLVFMGSYAYLPT